MNELTAEQIDRTRNALDCPAGILCLSVSDTAWLARAIIAAHEAQRQAGQEPVAVIDGIDDYGPRIGWLKHWVKVGVGTKLYAAPRPAIRQGGAHD